MADQGLPVAEPLERLFRASELSFDESTAGFRLRRTLPVLIYVDGLNSDLVAQFGEAVTIRIAELLADAGYRPVGQWGPHIGSYVTTIFGKGDRKELGGKFSDHINDLTKDVVALKDSVPPGIRLIVVVGTLVIAVAGTGAVVTAIPAATIPIQVLEFIGIVDGTVEAIDTTREVLGLNFDRETPKSFKLGPQ